ncbi:MAG: PilT/PilU family type 4a pilus ATPase [Deltaproteobacteria bacterium]|nr:PilT/PilU family type 4a pilus ATPase [Deltaproteobacteria bacterium]
MLRADGVDGRRRSRVRAFTAATETSTDAALFLPALKASIQGDDRLRRALLPLLMRTARGDALDPVVELLRSDERELRRFAHQLLLEKADVRVLPRLGRLMSTHKQAGTREAMEIAARVGGVKAIPLLTPFVTDGELKLRQQVLELLGDPEYFGKTPRQALEAIAPALSDPARAIALEAFRSYAALATAEDFYAMVLDVFEAGDDRRLQLTAVQSLARYEGERTAEVLGHVYRNSQHTSVRSAAIKAIRLRRETGVLPVLGEAIADDDPAIRDIALGALRKLSTVPDFDLALLLMWLLKSDRKGIAAQAMDLLAALGPLPGDLWPRLLEHLRSEDWWTRERVTQHLPAIAGPQLTQHIVHWLGDPSPLIRRYALECLARLRDPRVMEACLEVAVDDPDWWVRERAIECVAAIGDAAAVPHLVALARADDSLMAAILHALRTLRHAAALPLVLEMLQHEDPGIRHEAVLALEAVGEPSVAHVIFPLLKDPEIEVRRSAEELLGTWKARHHSIESDLGGQVEQLPRLLWHMTKARGDDLFLRAGQPAFMKRMGHMVRITDRVYTPQEVEMMLRSILSRTQTRQVESLKDVDLSMELKARGLRFRVNVLQQVTGWSGVFRRVSETVHSFEELRLPPLIKNLCDLPHGLVIVGGPTGSGKSTTLAAMIGWINQRHGRHIITVEDPIEVVHRNARAIVSQREVGSHTHSFSNALRSTLREDPDVILVGEMRDAETMSFAVTAAETGHLVLATLHTSSARNGIDRMIDSFSSSQQPQIRSMLAQTLRAVVCQQLLRRRDGRGRLVALELLLNTEPVAATIRKGTTFNLPSMISTGKAHGMQAMDEELKKLVDEGLVHPSEAYLKAQRKPDFHEFLESRGLEAANASS